jgi:hypothetical protein
MAILALLVRQPDTVTGVGLRLDEEHPSARWPRNIAHSSVPSLAEKGYVRMARSGPERSRDLYEVTPQGVEHFRKWLRKSSATVPMLRDALCAKLRYVETEDELRAVIREFDEQAKLCNGEAEAALARYTTARLQGRLQPRDKHDWKALVRRELMAGEVRQLYGKGKELQRMREGLENPHGESDALDIGAGDG